MYTRCPGCATVFRVTAEQLALREGQVRCGKCRAVFDANNHVIGREASPASPVVPDDTATAPSSTGFPAAGTAETAREMAAADARPPLAAAPIVPGDVTLSTDFGGAADVVAKALHEGQEPAIAGEDLPLEGLEQAPTAPESEYSQALDATKAAGAPEPTALASDAELEASTAQDGEDAAAVAGDFAVQGAPTEEARAETTPLPVDAAASSAAIAQAGASATAVSSEASPSIGEAGLEAAISPETALAPTPAVERGAAASPDRPIRYEWKPRARLREQPKALYGVAAAVLVLALAVQAVYGYRDLLAAHLPSTRPILQAACGVLGCVVEPLRDTAALSIEASDLQADPAHRGLLVLSATLRNRAAFAIGYPHLELTLTDASDRVVVRRAFAPAEYAGGTANLAAGIPANGEKTVKLFLDASATSQAGYRLYLFYP
jgi:predicted Zn finger-like uncharacterized protein